MKKFLLIIAIAIICIDTGSMAQCPPNATAYSYNYSLCSPAPGCAVYLSQWPEGVIVYILSANQSGPPTIVTSVKMDGTYPGPGFKDAFVCVPCGVPLTFASTVPNKNNGCVINGATPVPVKLSKFTAALTSDNNACSINWSTQTETGNEKYVVERSFDSRLFTEISTIKSKGSSSKQVDYIYMDQNITSANVYYRVKTVEITGKTSYSDVILVKNQASLSVSIYPNPVVAGFKVTIPAQHLPALVKVINAQGETVYSQKTTEATLNITDRLPNGVYAVKVTSVNNTTLTQKIIKQ